MNSGKKLIRLEHDLGQSFHLDVDKGWKLWWNSWRQENHEEPKVLNMLNKFELELKGENYVEIWRSLNINYSSGWIVQHGRTIKGGKRNKFSNIRIFKDVWSIYSESLASDKLHCINIIASKDKVILSVFYIFCLLKIVLILRELLVHQSIVIGVCSY